MTFLLFHVSYLIGCDNELAKIHTRHPDACDKVGGVIIMHIDDLRKFALLWLNKTKEVRADKAHYGKNFTGDIYSSGWISEVYGYSFGAAELKLRHIISKDILIYPGYIPEPGVNYRVFHYGLEFKVGNWSFDKANWRDADVVNKCWGKFPDPPDVSTLDRSDNNILQRDLLSIECAKTLNEALFLHHQRNCPDPNSQSMSNEDIVKKIASSRKFGRFERSDRHNNPKPVKHSQESSTSTDSWFSSFRIWAIIFWVFSCCGFMVVLFVSFSGQKSRVKGRNYRSKRKSYVDVNGRDRLLSNAES